MENYLNLRGGEADTHTHPAHMKTDSATQAVPFSGWKQNLINDARRERGSSSEGSPGPSRDGFGSEEKLDRVRLNVLFTLSSEKNAGFFKTGKIFEVRRKMYLNSE